MMRFARSLALAALACSAVVLGGCIIFAPALGGPTSAVMFGAIPNGPDVIFVNDTDVPLKIRYWVGRTDITAEGGVADTRTDDDFVFEADPGSRTRVGVGRPFWASSNADAVIWARIDIGGESMATDPTWLVLEHPGPYHWKALRAEDGSLKYERFVFDWWTNTAGLANAPQVGGISTLPRSKWIERPEGQLPVWVSARQAEAEALPQSPPLTPP